MKEEREQQILQQQGQVQQISIKESIRKIQHPQQQYLVNEVFSIRKQSSNMANDQIYKKLTKSFHRIKKLRADPNSSSLISKQYDYESDPVRLTFKRARELFNLETRTNLIVKKKIDKIRNRVDRIKNQVQNSQLSLISEVDVNKIYARSSQTTTQTNQGTPVQQRDKSK